MRSLLPLLGLLVIQPLFADKITLKNGEWFEGDFFGATSQEIRFVVDGKLMNFATTAVTMIQFRDVYRVAPAAAPAPEPAPKPPTTPPPAKTSATPPPAPRPAEPADSAEPRAPRPVSTDTGQRSASDRPTIRRRGTGTATGEPSTSQAPVETATRTDDDPESSSGLPDDFTIPRGTRLDVRLNESIDSMMNNSGQTFDAELVHPIIVRGKEIAPAGTSAVARMVESFEPGYGGSDSGSGRDPNEDRDQEYQVITVDLIALLIDGTRVPIRTNEVRRRIMSSKRDRAIEGLGRAGRELGTILGGSMGIPTGSPGPTGQPRQDTSSPRGGSIPMGTILQFRVEDDFSGISAENVNPFTE